MKLLLAQPAVLRFQWELEVLLTNLKEFGNFDVVLLFSQHDDTVPDYLAKKYGVQCFVYDDAREDKSYLPALRPYLWWRYLTEDSAREKEDYFYLDSDIIFRQMVDFKKINFNEKVWVGADCSGYIDYEYLSTRKNSEDIIENLCRITGITKGQMKSTPGAGAQWLISHPTADFWKKVYEDSNKIFYYFQGLESDIQKWTAEMWAQLFNIVSAGKKVKISPELDFCRPTDDIKMWNMVKILHNAGVTESGDLFFKGIYTHKTPFDEDFSHIRRDKVSKKYTEAIEKVLK